MNTDETQMKMILFPLGVMCAALALCNGVVALVMAALPLAACAVFVVLAVGCLGKACELDRRDAGPIIGKPQMDTDEHK